MNKREDILAQLDKCTVEFTFPILDNGYIYPAGTKLSTYRDDHRWVIVIEAIGFNYRGGGHNGISNCLHIYGNCLDHEPVSRNEDFICLTNDAGDCQTFDEEENFYLNAHCSSFLLRDQILPLYHDRKLYERFGIQIEDEDKIKAFEFLRLLDALHHDRLVATENEIRDRIPTDIPKVMELHEWFHPDLVNNEIPSQNETFIQIAQVLESGDIKHYKPTSRPNTNWVNWPAGGTL